jgi:hypothetical protein
LARCTETRSADPDAAWVKLTAVAAISGVCPAGFASTGLPAARAALTWPTKIASGKFHGLMHATGPSAFGWLLFADWLRICCA